MKKLFLLFLSVLLPASLLGAPATSVTPVTGVGGSATNAQPPSANLTNWSGIATNTVVRTNDMAANVTYADALVGNNAQGKPGRIDKPYRDIDWAATNAGAGGMVYVRPGIYTNGQWLMTGRTYWFDAGATSTLPATNISVPLIHDRAGAIVATVKGHGAFIQPGVAATLELTNPASSLIIHGDYITQDFPDEQVAATIHQGGGRLEAYFRKIRCVLYDCVWLDTSVIFTGTRQILRSWVFADDWEFGDNAVETSLAATRTNNWGDILMRGKRATPLTGVGTGHIGIQVNGRTIVDFDSFYCDDQTVAVRGPGDAGEASRVRLGMCYVTNGASILAAVDMGLVGSLVLYDTFIISSNATVSPIFANGSGTLTLENVRIHTGAQFCVSNGSARTVGILGSFTANTNEHSNITFASGAMARRTPDGLWVTPSPSSGTGQPPSENLTNWSTLTTNVLDQYINKNAGKGTNIFIASSLTVTGANSTALFRVNTNTLMVTNGLVGVGKTPIWTLDVGGTFGVDSDASVTGNLGLGGNISTSGSGTFGPVTNTSTVIKGTSANRLFSVNTNQFMVTNGLVGIGKTPTVALDVSGAIAASGNISGAVITGTSVGAGPIDGAYFSTADAAFETLAADNQVIVAGRSYILVQSDNVTAGNRTFLLDPAPVAGMVLTLEWVGTNAGELVDNSASGGATVRLSATWTPTEHDTLTLRYNGGDWIEAGRSTN